MQADPDVYRKIFEAHRDARQPAVKHEPVPDVLLPERVGRGETPYMDGADGNPRGTGEGGIREPQLPEIQ